MYDINFKNVKKGREFFYLALLCDFLLIIIFVIIHLATRVDMSRFDSEVMSKSVKLEEVFDTEDEVTYKSTYYFEVDGETYSCTSDVYTNFYSSQDNEKVFYNSKSPKICVPERDVVYSNSFPFWIINIIVVFIMISIVGLARINRRIKKIKELNMKGKLVKGLPYSTKISGVTFNNSVLLRPVVEYLLPGGDVITLLGDLRFDKVYSDADGLVDLLIDENNPKNYFIDFEINRLGGNLPTDYRDNMGGNFNNYTGFGEQNNYNMMEQENDIYYNGYSDNSGEKENSPNNSF